MYLVALSNVQCLQMLASLTKKPNPCSSDIKTAKNFKNSEAAEKRKKKKKRLTLRLHLKMYRYHHNHKF